MTKARDHILVLSPELDFVARNYDDICDIINKDVQVDPEIQTLTERVDRRGDEDAKQLIRQLANSLPDALRGVARVEWSEKVKETWQLTGTLYGPSGRKKKFGQIGLNITHETSRAPRFIAWHYPSGGLDGHRRIEALCKEKCRDIYLTDDRPDLLPGWGRCLIWFDEQLTRRSALDKLESLLRSRAKLFFRIVTTKS